MNAYSKFWIFVLLGKDFFLNTLSQAGLAVPWRSLGQNFVSCLHNLISTFLLLIFVTVAWNKLIAKMSE